MPLQPYTGTFGREELRHLLRRSLFGCTNADLAFFQGQSLTQVVNALLSFTNDTTPPIKTYWELNGNTPDPNLIDPDVPFGSTWVDTPVPASPATDPSVFRTVSWAYWRTGLMVQQERTLREKLSLFWYNTMPVQAGEVVVGRFLYDYDQLLRTNCKGNFRTLVREMSTSGAMLIYLNGTFNNVAQPDENFARELMELFTLGEGSGYTEADVQAAARVLTGWIVRLENNGVPIVPDTLFLPFLHDTGNKQFSAYFNNTIIQGQTGPNAGNTELNALLDMILAKEECGLHICRELYRFFVKGDIDAAIEQDVIEPLAELFRSTMAAPDQMEQVMRALLTSEHFFTSEVRSCMIKSPVDLALGAIRQLDLPLPTPAQYEAQYRVWGDIYGLVAFAGQELVNPPNVAGWQAYYQFPQFDKIWLDTATFPNRNSTLISIAFIGAATGNDLYQVESRNLSFRMDPLNVVAQFTDPYDPNALVADAAELLFATPISAEVQQQLKTNYLLLGQANDFYWSDAYEIYVQDPGTTNQTAMLVPNILLALFVDMLQAAENHLH